MAHPLVVHRKRSSYGVYIGRPSKWGNPFAVGRDGTRAEVIELYEHWVLTQRDLVAALPELLVRRSAVGVRHAPATAMCSHDSPTPESNAARAGHGRLK